MVTAEESYTDQVTPVVKAEDEDGDLIDIRVLADHTPNAQTAVTTIANRTTGTYEYQGELINDAGKAINGRIVVKVNP
ncbi:hypothetical protein BC351_24665 [Paenibacillus ferrarius]|uniref:Bacterial Ig domain-containing protein n=2 Tax=Paenibacillus ferrarius TaxID=1469647 RepID=A0A1V4HL63_9BACL|nr:hypothetical protein BC351_24665 [Paenibacillus ferrarius]